MIRDKQRLLKAHRLRKRRLMYAVAALLIVAAYCLPWWFPLLAALLIWLGHEAWGSDHLFYAPATDHHYRLRGAWTLTLKQEGDKLLLPGTLSPATSFVLELQICASAFGQLFDPQVIIGSEIFTFERGAGGRRYLCLSKLPDQAASGGLPLVIRHCSIKAPFVLTGFLHPDFTRGRLMIVAPHADDAELAAFGLYRQAQNASIVTVTQGEIEAEHYQQLGLDVAAAARLKGRLRSWDSIAIPMWGGVAPERCVQLGYFCMQLRAMQTDPEYSQCSRLSGEMDTRSARTWNRLRLPSDTDGRPTWNNLVADLSFLIDHFRPDAIVAPHPARDPHPDHIAVTQALAEAAERAQHKPRHYLLYANHLHDNDRWPLGPAGGGITLPPGFDGIDEEVWLQPTDATAQVDKAMALAMEHDLQQPLPFKKRMRRRIQILLAGRRWPAYGSNEYFRKAVRSAELFSVCEQLPPCA